MKLKLSMRTSAFHFVVQYIELSETIEKGSVIHDFFNQCQLNSAEQPTISVKFRDDIPSGTSPVTGRFLKSLLKI